MSVKLGNIDIAGTQVLYSTTGNNTDGAMTQAATTTALNNKADNSVVNLKANDADVVHLTGNETINNEKTFTANLTRAHTDITKGTNPSSPLYWGVEFTDKNGPTPSNRLGILETKLNTNGDVETYISSYLNTSGSSTQTALKIVYTKSGNTFAIAPASDINDSIVTTVNKSKAANGYFKLGNGMIIQWMKFNYSTGDKAFTFPTPFTTTNIGMSFMFIDEARNNTPSIKNISTTGGTFHPNGYSSGGNIWLIAVGY